MATLLDTIKKVALQTYKASNPVNVLYGEVIKTKPLEIRIHERLLLTADFLDVGDQLIKAGGLQVNDKVILLRVQGGQRFYVSDRYKAGESL